MRQYFRNIFAAVWTVMVGMKITFRQIFDRAATHQYPYEKKFEQKMPAKWQGKNRNNRREIHDAFRGRLHNRVEDCIGCTSCARDCPVECITIETERAGRDEDLGETRNVLHLKDGATIVGIVEGDEKLAPDTNITIQDLEGQTHTYPSDQVESIIARRKKRTRIAQYDIDMSLCMFCGLCMESCPTECLTMGSKREDFAFSTYNLEDLIYHFVEPPVEETEAQKGEVEVSNN